MDVDAQGVMRMREIDGIALAPKAVLRLRPGAGLHLMLIGLKAPLKEGTSFPMTLEFEKRRRGRGEGRRRRQAPAMRHAHALSAVARRARRRALRERAQRELDAGRDPDVGRQRLQRRRRLAVAVAERDQRLEDVGLRARGDARRRGDRVAELALELEQQPLGRLLADARHLDQAAALLQAHGPRELVDEGRRGSTARCAGRRRRSSPAGETSRAPRGSGSRTASARPRGRRSG